MAKTGEEFVCHACGKPTVKTGINQKFCPDCRIPSYKSAKREYEKQVAEEKKNWVFNCKMCGKQGVKKVYNQVYCEKCRKNMKNKYDRVVGEQFECASCGKSVTRTGGNQVYCAECAAEKRKPKQAEPEEWEILPVPKPISEPDFTIAEVCAAARKHNMTYGKYVSAWQNGMVEPPEKFPKKRGRKKKNDC